MVDRLRVGAVAVALAVLGCGGDNSKAGAACPRTAPIGVAAVNGWPGVDAEQYATALEASCQSLTEIEAFPWFDRFGACDDARPGLCTETFREQRRAFLRSMSAHGVTTHVVTLNSNAVGPRQLSEEAFRRHVVEIREDAEEIGISKVWLGSPSEPWQWDGSRGRRRAEIAREEWPGIFVVPDAGGNRATGRPYWPGIGYDYLEVHPCTIEAARASIARGLPILTVTDCTPVLNPGPVVSAELARLAIAAHAPLVLYDFRGTAPDLAGIAAVGREIAEAGS